MSELIRYQDALLKLDEEMLILSRFDVPRGFFFWGGGKGGGGGGGGGGLRFGAQGM